MSTQETVFRSTFFLDTNVLQYMISYLRVAKRRKLLPYGDQEQSYDDINRRLRRKLPKGIANHLMNGCKTLAFLQQQTSSEESDAAIYTSRLSKAELIYGVLEGQAHARLARAGFSYRMRQRVRDLSELVSMYLQRTDYGKIQAEIEDLFIGLEKDRIHVQWAEENVTDFSTVAAFSEFLQTRVFLDVLDCWMYGCALAVQADRIVTFDGYFRNVINKIHNPQGDAGWQQVRATILEELKRLFPVETSIELSLPEVQSLPNVVPHLWRENHA
jgi:hypothetical protein